MITFQPHNAPPPTGQRAVLPVSHMIAASPVGPLIDIARRTAAFRGLYRVFNSAVYRFYRSSSAPPAETDTPYATSASLPSTPADTFGNGTWYVSVSLFNGVIDSGFLPIGPDGQRYIRIDIAAGAETNSPPNGPLTWELQLRPEFVVRVSAVYMQSSSLRADEWAIAFTQDGSTPATDTPDVTVTIPTSGAAVLSYDLPALGGGGTTKVRLQTRRFDDPTQIYSEDSDVKTNISVAPSAPAPLWGTVI